MNILIFANFNNDNNLDIEGSIVESFEDNHSVTKYDERDFDKDDFVEKSNSHDMVLFFKAGVPRFVDLDDFEDALYDIETTKVCWYFDKVWQGRERFIQTIAPLTDYIFMSDGTFVRRHNFFNTYEMKQSTDADGREGSYRKELDIPIVFPGTVYGQREHFYNVMKSRYGEAFKVVNGVYGQDFYDLCESAKIFVSPEYPQDHHYWSNRVYNIIGRGGFMIHPYLHKLTDEFEEGEHIEYYRSPEELVEKIEYYLENDEERDRIRLKGREHCLENFNYQRSINQTLKTING